MQINSEKSKINHFIEIIEKIVISFLLFFVYKTSGVLIIGLIFTQLIRQIINYISSFKYEIPIVDIGLGGCSILSSTLILVYYLFL